MHVQATNEGDTFGFIDSLAAERSSSAANLARQVLKVFPYPPVIHSIPRIVASTCALSASSVSISSRICAGLRCLTSSPPLGFFTDRSNVVGSMSLASTAQDL